MCTSCVLFLRVYECMLQGLRNQAFFVALGYIPHAPSCTLNRAFHNVIYPNSKFAGQDRVRINIIIGYSFRAISDVVRIDRLNIFSWRMDLDAWRNY